MADNVNIIVQDTINDIVVNAAQIVETIDINVQAAVDVVDIVANPNNYVVNINRIIGEQVQSDWTQNDNQAPDYIKNKPTLAAVATSGDYDDLINKPTIPTNTSDLVNDGENGVDPFITAADIPPVTGFVPYTGATEDVNLGEFELKAGQLTLDTTPTGTAAVATTQWNDTTGVSQTTLKGGTVALKNGVDLVARVVNKVTPNSTLLRANYTAVRISGAQGQRLAVAYAQANNDNNSADTIGLVCENIATNQEGFIMTMGQFEEINTTGSLQGETWADGDVLYLSPITAGRLTNIKPTGLTGHIVVMGYVEYAHAIHGKIYVKIMNGWELDELHNVYINSPLNNDGLFYDSADLLWKNKTIAAALGYTPENVANKSTSTSLGTSDTLYPTQNAVKVYADTKFTLPSLTSGSVLFSNGTTISQSNANLFWDNTNNRLGIGTNAPSVSLDLNANYTFNTGIGRILNIKANSGPTVIAGFGTGMNFGLKIGSGAVEDVAYIDVLNTQTFRSGDISFKVSQGSSPTEAMRINYLGNILLGTSTNAGFKLDVNGTARVNGNATFGTLGTGTGMFWDNTNNRLGIGTATPAYGLDVLYTSNNSTGNNAIRVLSTNSAATAEFRVENNLNYSSRLFKLGSAYASYKILSPNDLGFYNSSQGGHISILNDFASGLIKFAAGGSLNSQMTLFSTGNLSINTTTDAGFKLDVNGTARVSGAFTQNGSSLVSTTSGYWQFANSGNSTTFGSYISQQGLSYTGTQPVCINVTINNHSASATFQIDSTTKGFLPPRMTTTQKNAIATPAAGLIVYDTTLNKLCVRTAAAWETITSI